MSSPKFYRDPVHLQIRYEAADVALPFPADRGASMRLSWLVQTLVDSPEFQRLRHIRQNGLTNLVFHGAEHSRFSHSMGVAHLAGEMYARIERSGETTLDAEHMVATCVAALLHDVGHGPFSHTLEEILKEDAIEFDHEVMTQRLIEEDESEINKILRTVDATFPTKVVHYIDKKKRRKASTQEHWRYRIVSSQLDADRLDYLLRDSRFAGLQGGFDLSRLLDSLRQLDAQRIAVDRRSLVTVEAYLVMLDQMYRAVYYHHAVRGASVLMSSVVRRAFALYRTGDTSIFPAADHPLRALADEGQRIALDQYARLSEFHVWSLIESWRFHADKILSDLANRILRRQLFKTIDVDSTQRRLLDKVEDHARDLVQRTLSHVDATTAPYYVSVDEPGRTSYKRYDWRSESPDESIWLVGDAVKPTPIEESSESSIVSALKATKYFHRLVFPGEIKLALVSNMKTELAQLQKR